MTPLPPLTEKIDRGAHGGHEFERLMHRLLLRHADRYSFLYRPVHGAGGDAGVDGIAPALSDEVPRKMGGNSERDIVRRFPGINPRWSGIPATS